MKAKVIQNEVLQKPYGDGFLTEVKGYDEREDKQIEGIMHYFIRGKEEQFRAVEFSPDPKDISYEAARVIEFQVKEAVAKRTSEF